jgi:beta-glucanase (GH16 family)
MKKILLSLFGLLTTFFATAQVLEVSIDFEGSSDFNFDGDNLLVDNNATNPNPSGINTSSGVMEYVDFGGDFGNARLDLPINLDLSDNSTFTVMIYVPSSSITGEQNNQVSLKLQNGNLESPWFTQTEIIQPIVLDEWQELTFDFSSDEYVNFSPSSPPPTERFDFNRIVLQVNGEGNQDLVNAYFDNFEYDGVLDPDANPTNSIYTELVWADEFENEGAVNADNWFHQTLLPDGFSWFNNEQQHYTDRIENSYVLDGNLHISAIKEIYVDQGIPKEYTSARLNSKFAFTYGRVVARAIMPTGGGTWPAIWMLGKNIAENGGYWNEEFGEVAWPACGEIDIMEHWGNNQNVISAALHTPSSFGATENYGTIFDEDVSEEYHTYEMVWTPTEIEFYLDGINYYTYQPDVYNDATWPFTADQYLLLNIAIESNVDPLFEQSDMIMDYIRVYQEPGPTGTFDLDEINVRLFPNPAQNILNIQTDEVDPTAQIEVFDLRGARLISQQVTGSLTTIDLSNLANGAYIVNFRGTTKFGSSSFIKTE